MSDVGQPINPANAGNQAERELWTGRPSQLINIKVYTICLLLCVLIVPIFIAIWRYIVVRAMKYELTTERFRISEGVFTRVTNELELYRVKDTTLTQSFFQRVFGLATIGMTTSDTTHPQVYIESISAQDAKEVREALRHSVETMRERKRVREYDSN